MSHKVPARLHVLLARESTTGVVIRRGPSRHTAIIGWDRQTDHFEIGQWFSGRIYERRCDLSPDGAHFIYFAMNGRWASKAKGAWTAISRAPYLRALTLYAKGDCWHGGGLFQSSHKYWLNDGSGHELQLDNADLVKMSEYPWHESYGGECLGVYYIRLQRDGWTLKPMIPYEDGHITVFEKNLSGHWILRKLAHATLRHPIGRGVYYDTHELWNCQTEEVISCEGWEWADIDGERLVWAAEGMLHSGYLDLDGLKDKKVLNDFNHLQFERIKAPY